MDLRHVWHLRLPTAQEPKPPPEDDLTAQEDEESRAVIARYLRLADRLLSPERAPEQDKDDDTAA